MKLTLVHVCRVQTANVFHIIMSHSEDDLILVESQSCDSWPLQTTKSNLQSASRSNTNTHPDTGTHIRCHQRWHMCTISTKQTMSWISENRCTREEKKRKQNRREKKLGSCLTVRHGNEMAKPIYLMAFLIPSEKYSSFLPVLLSFCSECVKNAPPIARECKSEKKIEYTVLCIDM